MSNILEILIIAVSGLAAAVFLAWYFYSSTKKQKCSGCSFCINDDNNKKTITTTKFFKCPVQNAETYTVKPEDFKKKIKNS